MIRLRTHTPQPRSKERQRQTLADESACSESKVFRSSSRGVYSMPSAANCRCFFSSSRWMVVFDALGIIANKVRCFAGGPSWESAFLFPEALLAAAGAAMGAATGAATAGAAETTTPVACTNASTCAGNAPSATLPIAACIASTAGRSCTSGFTPKKARSAATLSASDIHLVGERTSLSGERHRCSRRRAGTNTLQL